MGRLGIPCVSAGSFHRRRANRNVIADCERATHTCEVCDVRSVGGCDLLLAMAVHRTPLTADNAGRWYQSRRRTVCGGRARYCAVALACAASCVYVALYVFLRQSAATSQRNVY